MGKISKICVGASRMKMALSSLNTFYTIPNEIVQILKSNFQSIKFSSETKT